jgi:hypothetical protein
MRKAGKKRRKGKNPWLGRSLAFFLLFFPFFSVWQANKHELLRA